MPIWQLKVLPINLSLDQEVLTSCFQEVVEVLLGAESVLSGDLDHLEVETSFFARDRFRSGALALSPTSSL